MPPYTKGMIVCWDNDSSDSGEVIHVTDTAVSVKWLDDGIIGIYKLASPAIQHLTPTKEGTDEQPSVS